MSQPPSLPPLPLDYQSRQPTTARSVGFSLRFAIGLFLGPSVLMIIIVGWGLAIVRASDHYLGQTPVGFSITIHGIAVLSIISVIIGSLWLLRRPAFRAWVWGGAIGIASIFVLIAMTAIRTLF